MAEIEDSQKSGFLGDVEAVRCFAHGSDPECRGGNVHLMLCGSPVNSVEFFCIKSEVLLQQISLQRVCPS